MFNSRWRASCRRQAGTRTVTGMKTHSHIPMAKDSHCSHKAQHTSGLILRKWRCYPQVEPVKMSRIRCRIFKGSWRAGEGFPGPVAWGKGQQKDWCTKVPCNAEEMHHGDADFHLLSISHWEVCLCAVNTGCPCLVLLWSQLITPASWPISLFLVLLVMVASPQATFPSDPYNMVHH